MHLLPQVQFLEQQQQSNLGPLLLGSLQEAKEMTQQLLLAQLRHQHHLGGLHPLLLRLLSRGALPPQQVQLQVHLWAQHHHQLQQATAAQVRQGHLPLPKAVHLHHHPSLETASLGVPHQQHFKVALLQRQVAQALKMLGSQFPQGLVVPQCKAVQV
jgi:hypothetical protein